MEDNIAPGKYLVIGGSGLVGSAILSRLNGLRGVSVVSVYFSNSPKVFGENIVHVQADLRDRKRCREVMGDADYVFHVASNIILRSMLEKEVIHRMTSNVLINMCVLESAYLMKIKKMLWIGSTTAYPSKEHLIEDDIFEGDPLDRYFAVGWEHRYVEKMCILYSRKISEKFPIAIIRPTCIYGENSTFDLEKCHILPYLVRRVIERKGPIELWNGGETKVDYLYVDDAAKVCISALIKLEDYSVFNVGYGRSYSANEIVEIICGLEGIDNLDVKRCGVLDTEKRTLSFGKINKEFGFTPSVDIHEGIGRLIREYKRSYA